MENHEQDPLEDAPLLRSIPRTDPFVVPEGFFEQFPHRVQAAVTRPPSLRTRLSDVWAALHPAIRVAGLGLALVLVALPFLMDRRSDIDDAIAEVPTGKMDAVDALLDDDEALLAALAVDEDAFSAVGQGISDEELAAFVEQQELPLEFIAEEL